MRYFKFPKWLKRFYPEAIWDFSFSTNNRPTIYLTFDDGPNPNSTNWILAELKKWDAKATFFCIGKNVKEHPELFQKLLDDKHQTGNHTQNHLNGAYTKTTTYIKDIKESQVHIKSKLFRPPYGKLKPNQYKALKKMGLTTVFWSHITYDFDTTFSPNKRIEKTLNATKDGDIVVFHDSDKAFPQLKEELPVLLEKWHKTGFQFKAITINNEPH